MFRVFLMAKNVIDCIKMIQSAFEMTAAKTEMKNPYLNWKSNYTNTHTLSHTHSHTPTQPTNSWWISHWWNWIGLDLNFANCQSSIHCRHERQRLTSTAKCALSAKPICSVRNHLNFIQSVWCVALSPANDRKPSGLGEISFSLFRPQTFQDQNIK